MLILAVSGVFRGSKSFQPPSRSALAGLSLRARIVAIANSQVGYKTDPSDSYCNKFSSFWHAGNASCRGGELSEKWCADFAAWAWRRAGAPFSYGYGTDQLNAGAASFYTWGVAHGTWHPAQSGYAAQPGDVAIYGLTFGAVPSAVHVAIVTAQTPGRQAPDVINGDGDRTGFSVVETGTAQLQADTGHGHDSQLAGYVSPA